MLAAAENNARWCDVVCRSHGVPTTRQHGYWAALRRAPSLYPDAVSLRPDAATDDVLRLIDDGPGCAVKDSFAALGLARRGFDELFAAHWIYRGPAPQARPSSLTWSPIVTADALTRWARAAGQSDTFGVELLAEPSVRFLAAFTPDGLAAGAVANRTGNVVGVSNVFATLVSIDDCWAGIAGAVGAAFPGLPQVGYEHGDALQAALAGGFTSVGQLRVWLRRG